MALKKDLVSFNGTTTTYHKISNIKLDNDNKKITVTIKDYISDDIREKEKDEINDLNRMNELIKLIDEENATSHPNTELVINYSNEYNSLIEKNDYSRMHERRYYVSEKEYELNYEENLSIEYIYDELKKLDDFKDSEDI